MRYRGKDVVREVKGVEKGGVRGACTRAQRRWDGGGQVEIDGQGRGLRHDVSDLALEAIEESCAFGEDCVLIGLR